MLTRLALIALVLLTSLSLGMVRGQIQEGDQLVLCGGSAVITDPDDPRGGARFCPDMAAGLLLTLDPPPVAVLPPARPWRRAELPAAPACTPQAQPPAQARGPPPASAA